VSAMVQRSESEIECHSHTRSAEAHACMVARAVHASCARAAVHVPGNVIRLPIVLHLLCTPRERTSEEADA
jgi:hypothetical protein